MSCRSLRRRLNLALPHIADASIDARRAGKMKALGNWLVGPVKARSPLADSKPKDGSAPSHPNGNSDHGRRSCAGRGGGGLAVPQRQLEPAVVLHSAWLLGLQRPDRDQHHVKGEDL